MKYEIIQFYRAINAKITAADQDYLRIYLSQQEQIIFFRQRISDQRHELDTAHKIQQDIEGSDWINVKRIIKMALLHDIGKINVFMPLWVRPAAVILKKLAPGILNWLTKKGADENAGIIYKYFYTYVFHAELGERFLREIGSEKEVATLVKMHHDLPSPNEPKELPIFRRADNS